MDRKTFLKSAAATLAAAACAPISLVLEGFAPSVYSHNKLVVAGV